MSVNLYLLNKQAQQEGIQPRISSPQEEGRGGQPVAFGRGQQRENQGKHITFFMDFW